MYVEALLSFGIDAGQAQVSEIGSGLINDTWVVNTDNKTYILQRINDRVFKQPRIIDHNINKITAYLVEHRPNYMTTPLIPDLQGSTLVYNSSGYYRLFLYIPDSLCFDTIDDAQLAFEAARQFGRFTSYLSAFPAESLEESIPDFHNLSLRYAQYKSAVTSCVDTKRLETAHQAMQLVSDHHYIVKFYEEKILGNREVMKRVCHHDTKLSNVLFNQERQGICVIDLDTVMPGYFISDLGDMLRTYICAENEEAKINLPSKIKDSTPHRIRLDFFKSVVTGYLIEMKSNLTEFEKGLVLFAGKYMIYMQAVRFLADYLSGDVYYKVKHNRHNLDRAENQLLLLDEFCALHVAFQNIVDEAFTVA